MSLASWMNAKLIYKNQLHFNKNKFRKYNLKNLIEWKKKDTNEYIFGDSTYIKFKTR